MQITVPDKIEAVLLYDRAYPEIASADLCGYLNFVLEPSNIKLEVLHKGEGSSFTLMAGSGFFVLVSQNRHPLGAEGFAPALGSPIRQLLFADLDAAVTRHSSNIFITVSNDLPMGDAADALLRELGMHAKPLPRPVVEAKLTICQLLTGHLARLNRPSAIHWCQSDQLMTPEYFATITDQRIAPAALCVHPSLFSSRKRVGSRQVIGLVTFGARHLIGREVAFEEAPVEIGWMLMNTWAFVDMACANGGQVVPHGQSFGANANEVIRVRHREPAKGETLGNIELVVERSDEMGIQPATRAGQSLLGRVFGGGKPTFGRRGTSQ